GRALVRGAGVGGGAHRLVALGIELLEIGGGDLGRTRAPTRRRLGRHAERVTTPGGDRTGLPDVSTRVSADRPGEARARRRRPRAARTRPNGCSHAAIATGAARTGRGPRPLCEEYARARPTPVGRGLLVSQLSDLIDPSAISLDITAADW